MMKVPDRAEIDSEFQVLDDDFEEPDFYGGAFEGSHAFADVIVLRLYSIVPTENGDQLRIETRHHYSGQVIDHSQLTRELTEERQVAGSNENLETFCRTHHFENPRTEIESLIETIEDSEEYRFY